jgi:hypothetical protein
LSSNVTRNILLIVIVILLVGIVGLAVNRPSSQPSTQLVSTLTVMQPTTVVSVQTVTVTPTPTVQATTAVGQYDVVIRYTENSQSKIGFSEAKAGYTYLVLTLQIQNNVDREFSTNPLYFYVIVKNVKYEVDFATYSLSDTLQAVQLQKGGTISGSLVFQIPTGVTSYSPGYEAPFTTVNIQWIHS